MRTPTSTERAILILESLKRDIVFDNLDNNMKSMQRDIERKLIDILDKLETYHYIRELGAEKVKDDGS